MAKGKVFKQRYARGITQSELEVIGDTDKTGIVTEFMPDAEIFESIEFDYEFLSHRLRELAFLTKGLAIHIGDERTGDSDVFHFEGGLRNLCDSSTKGAMSCMNPQSTCRATATVFP